MKKALLFTILVFVLIGCTSYQPFGFTGGYSETQLDYNMFKVSFRGNGYTSSERVGDFALLRCDEITLQNNFNYFIINDQDNKTVSTSHHTTGKVTKDLYFNSATINTSTRTISKSKAIKVISCFKDKPENIFSYNAEFIYKTLREKYNLDK